MADWETEAIRRIWVLLKKKWEVYFQGRFKVSWMKDVRSLVLSAPKTVIMNTQSQGHRNLFLGEVGGWGSVNRWMLPPPKSKSKLEARADPFPSDTGSLLGPLLTRVPGTMEALPYIWWGNNPHPEEELQGEGHDRGDRERGKGALECPVLPKREREGNSKGIQEMSSPQPRKVCGEDASSVRSVCFPI